MGGFLAYHLPAEFMLEAIGAGSRRRVGPRDWADIWRDSEECAGFKREIEELKAKSLARPVEHDPDAERECECSFRDVESCMRERGSLFVVSFSKDATPFLYQLKIVSTRMVSLHTFGTSSQYVVLY